MKINERDVDHNINEIFPNRWSPRAMSGELIEDEKLMSLFEAARWAPSSYNEQPWIFLYAKKGTEHFDKFFNLLVDFNKSWAKNASHLILILSRKNSAHNNNPNPVHSFDTGSAWMSLALQGSLNNLVVHGMGGFDKEKAKLDLKISDKYHIEAMAAIGKLGKKENLPEDLVKMEVISTRKPITEFVYEGGLHGSS